MKKISIVITILLLLSIAGTAQLTDYTTSSSFTDTYKVKSGTYQTNNTTKIQWDATYIYDIKTDRKVIYSENGEKHILADLKIQRTDFGDWLVENGENETGNLWKAKISQSFARQSKYRGKHFGQDMSRLQSANLKDSLDNPPVEVLHGSLEKVNGNDYSGSDIELNLHNKESTSLSVTMEMDDVGASFRLGHGSVDWSTVSSAEIVYRFNESVGPAIDYSQYGRDGNFIGTPATGQPGISKTNGDWGDGLAYDFDGNDDAVNVTKSFDFTTSTEFTLSAWVKGTSIGEFDVIMGQRNTNAEGWYIRIVDDGEGNIVPQLNLRDDTTGSNAKVEADTDITDGEWHHIVAEWDPGLNQGKIWVDGVEEGSDSLSEDFNTDTFPQIGHSVQNNEFSEYFDGVIDEPKIFSKELNSTEIQNLYEYNQLNAVQQNQAPTFSDEDPADGDTVVSDTDLTITADDPEGDGIQVLDIYWGNGTFIDGIQSSQTGPYTFSTDTLDLVGGENYSWYARSCDSNNNCANSTTFTFDRASPPEITPPGINPVTENPADGATDINDTQFTGPPSIGVIFNGITLRDNDTSQWIQYDIVLENQTGGYTVEAFNETPSYDSDDAFVSQDTEAYGLDSGTTYDWHYEVEDPQYSITGPTWTFTTNSTPNDPPTFSDENPGDGATGISVTTDLEITVDDPEGDGIQTVDFYWGNGTSIYNLSQTNVPPVTVDTPSLDLAYNTTYKWYVESCDDQSQCATSSTYDFTTRTSEPTIADQLSIESVFIIGFFLALVAGVATNSALFGIFTFVMVLAYAAIKGVLPQWASLVFVMASIVYVANAVASGVSGG